MKKSFIVLLLVLLINVFAVSAFQEVKASILKYEPAPAEQGKTFDVWVQIVNSGKTADNVAVRFVPKYPFSLAEGQIDEVDVGVIAPTETKVVKFTVFVASDAQNGDSDITFWYRFAAGKDWVQLESPISLETQDAVVVVDKYVVNPSPIIPGQTFTVDLYLLNAGRMAVKNVDASIDVEDKFSTIGTGASKRVAFIGPGETEKVSFELASDTSTEVKVYNVPLGLSYKDDRNKEYSATSKISLVVNAKPELSLSVDKTDFADKKKPGTVTLKIVNKGVIDVKYLTVTLVQNERYDVLSPSNEAYVGNLDSDDFETVDFLIKPLVDDPRLLVKLDFKDQYNLDFSQQYDLPLRIYTAKDLGQTSFPYGLVIIIVLVIAGIVYWRFHKKKK